MKYISGINRSQNVTSTISKWYIQGVCTHSYISLDIFYKSLTTMTCSHFNCSSAASSRATNASLDPSGSMHGGNAMNRVRPQSTASHGCRVVRKVSRNGGAPLVCPGASGPPQRPCAQRRRRRIDWDGRIRRAFTTHKKVSVKEKNIYLKWVLSETSL